MIQGPVVKTQMLIRKPAKDVYQAFVDPAITTHFWFTKSSGKLKEGQTTIWEWEMYNATSQVYTTALIQNKKISFEWGPPETVVDIELTPITGKGTLVIIYNYGFKETGQQLWDMLVDVTGGFTTVLDGLKAYLEHGIELNLIGDKFPKEK